jgi:hypothetical protein
LLGAWWGVVRLDSRIIFQRNFAKMGKFLHKLRGPND